MDSTKHDYPSKDDELTTGAAAKLLTVHPDTLRRWENAGHIKSWRTPGGQRRFSTAAVLQLKGRVAA